MASWMSALQRGMFVGLAAAAIVACGADAADELGSSEASVETSPGDASLLVDEPSTVAELENHGLSLASILGVQGTTARDLLASPKYERIVATIDRDLRLLRMQDPRSGVGIEFPHRQLDTRWLRSAESRLELVAVVNRLDRMHVAGCGELRLVYRLAYTAMQGTSRLPMTVNVVYPQADDGALCQTVAQRWLDAKTGRPDALLAGPLAALPAIGQIEINFQAVRWPSNERPEMGGHAEYILRVFRPAGETVEPAPLENTPRTDLNATEREELRGWIRDHLDQIDDGTAILPAKLSATQAISVGPRGLARVANRSFAQLFKDPAAAFGDLPFSTTKQIGSVAALMRRLDTMTCHGCHQARSIAGFHLLGEERDENARVNALAVTSSPHLVDELAYRKGVLRAVASGEAARAPRPFAEHAASSGHAGAHCGLGDPGFASWTCDDGLSCLDVHGGAVGMCMPAAPALGGVCETVRLSSNPDSHRDRVVAQASLACAPHGGDGADTRCIAVEQGFPDGMCRADCAEADIGVVRDATICGLVPSASGLTQCLAAHRPFAECLSADNTPTLLAACDARNPCRDDFACARVPGGPAKVGACMPPYFAFQVRVDGHLFDD